LRKAFPTDSLYPEENRVNLFRQVSWLSLLLQPSRRKYLQQWQGVAKAHPSNDGLRITVAGTAPAFNRIPFFCMTLNQVMQTKTAANIGEFLNG
jgi:hypothetical protein